MANYPRLDEDGLAHYLDKTKPIHLSKAEYSALSDAQKKSGQIYFVDDEVDTADIPFTVVNGAINITYLVED